jgi:hypothetical protein
MKGYFVNGNPVHTGLGVSHAGKYVKRPLLRSRPQAGCFQKFTNILPRAVGVFMAVMIVVVVAIVLVVVFVVIMFMLVFMMIMIVTVVMMAIMLMLVFVVIMAVPVMIFACIHDGAGTGDPVPFFPAEFQLPAFKAEFVKFTYKRGGIRPRVHKGAQSHVA